MMKKISRTRFRSSVWSWALYDWANSAFATTVMAGFFPLFYSTLSADLSTEDSQFWFNLTLAGSGVLMALIAPLLGSIADLGGGKKKFLITFALLGAAMSIGLAWVHAGMWQLGLLLYGLGTIGFSGANVFYDAMLVDVADEDDLDVVSGLGYAVGYAGGGVLFAVNVLMVLYPHRFGLADSGAAVSASFITVGVWWALFLLPLAWNLKDPRKPGRLPAPALIKAGWAQCIATLREIRQFKTLTIFLLSYWLYIDGVNTVIKVAVFFASRVLALPPESLVGALLLTQFVAFPAALLFGWLGRRIGARAGILIALAVYCAVVLYAWRWLHTGADFYLLAVAIGLVQGGVQSLSRSLYARLIPKSKVAEFFGLYNVIGKFASILGPLLMTGTTLVFAGVDVRASILSLLVLFVVGAGLLLCVPVERGIQAAARYDAQQAAAPTAAK